MQDITTQRPQSSSFGVFIFRIPKGNPKKELLWGLWVIDAFHGLRGLRASGFWVRGCGLKLKGSCVLRCFVGADACMDG